MPMPAGLTMPVFKGCPPTAAGEAAMSAVNVMQLRWPGSAMLLGADLLHHCLEGAVTGQVDVGEAVRSDGKRDGNIPSNAGASNWESLPLRPVRPFAWQGSAMAEQSS
jgi:hypothetical protein